jgi:hypothetical protein
MIIFIVLLLAQIFFNVYMLTEFFAYLAKYHVVKWKELSFERPFGISQEDFYFYPIRPLKFIPFVFEKNDINDRKVAVYKNILKLSLITMAFSLLIFSFF